MSHHTTGTGNKNSTKLPCHNLIRWYHLQGEDTVETSAAVFGSYGGQMTRMKMSSKKYKPTFLLEDLKSTEKFGELLVRYNNKCKADNMVKVYHYTNREFLQSILEYGMRMCYCGQGDGGSYFTDKGPFSLGLGTELYEVNLITMCYGEENVVHYLGKHRLDVLIIYACPRSILVQVFILVSITPTIIIYISACYALIF